MARDAVIDVKIFGAFDAGDALALHAVSISRFITIHADGTGRRALPTMPARAFRRYSLRLRWMRQYTRHLGPSIISLGSPLMLLLAARMLIHYDYHVI